MPNPAPRKFLSYINGEWLESRSGETCPNSNPATGDLLGEISMASREETRAAIEAAHRAFEPWRDTPAPQRANLLFKALRIMEGRKEELAQALTMEEGKVIGEARGEVQKTLNLLEFIAGEGRRLNGETTPSELPNTFCYTVRQPLGVVGLITPWNFPVAIPVWKIAPALVAGNTVVFKPATLTPWTACLIMEIFHEAGLPAGVLNMVLGRGSTVGDEIQANPLVQAISFTGSNEVGREIYRRGAERGIKIQCEMGGKNPLVVLDDADLQLAAEATAQGGFGSTGQRCTATSRAIVMESVADEFVSRLAALAGQVVVGDGLQAGVTMGPSVDEGQLKVVLDYLETGRQEGATLVTGGRRLSQGEHGRGFFVEPTIFDHVQPEMRIAREEIFGPVISVIRVRDLDHALEVANSVEFGLSSSVYTHDINRVFRFLDRIETGITHVNSPTMGGEAQLPFGGVKQTGVGPREQGKTAVEFYTELKTVYIDYTGRKRETNIY